jgi:hypothetical protein
MANIESKGDNLAISRRQALLDRLSALGECEFHQDWLDCQAVGIGPEMIPDLIDIALDDELHDAPSESSLIWAPVHAWRALAGLRAAEAVEPLTRLLQRTDEPDDDWVLDEIPLVFGKIGPPGIPVLTRYLNDATNGQFARIACIHGLQEIATNYPDVRDEIVAILSDQLKLFEKNDSSINGFLISHMLDLKAVEAAPLMERAFAADCVDLTIAGDWEDIQVALGLLPKRKTRHPNYLWSLIDAQESPERTPAGQSIPNSRQARRKAEREAAKKKRVK